MNASRRFANRLPAPLKVLVLALVDWAEEAFLMLGANLLLFICLPTVLLGPPALLGLYVLAYRHAEARDVRIGHMIDGGRRYFGLAWLLALVNLVALAVVAAGLVFFWGNGALLAVAAQALFIALGFYWFTALFYALPLLMGQEQPALWNAVLRGIFAVSASPIYTIILAGIFAGLIFLMAWKMPLLLIAMPSLIALAGSHAVLERRETFRARYGRDEN